jgi:uncharacterized protein YdeI (YjbR/CyaY-like superfamily)
VPVKKEAIETFCPTTTQKWRQWLQKNHVKKKSIWLIYFKKKSKQPIISWSEAVEEALCFGWIDSLRRPLDEERFLQFFSQRKAISTWSKVNKEKVKKLIGDGRMTEAGLKSIAIAKQNGSWTLLDSVEALVIPKDLEKEFKAKPGTKKFFLGLSKSVKKRLLQWLVLAKREETRQKRIIELVELAAAGLIPKQFR